MRFLIIGGSGRTGKLVISDILKRGHQVTALVRNPTSLRQQPGLDIVKGANFLPLHP
jgi:putative NADH-flavin reductase